MAFFDQVPAGGGSGSLLGFALNPTAAPAAVSSGTFIGGDISFGDTVSTGSARSLATPQGLSVLGNDPLPTFIAIGGLGLLAVLLFRRRK